MAHNSTNGSEITRFHGIDRHLKYSTIAVMDRKGSVIGFQAKCMNLQNYLASLGPNDAVAFEVGNCAFAHSDIARDAGAHVCIVDPRKFRIICSSYKKTDRNDAYNICAALRSYILDLNDFRLPLVFCPSPEVRRLRQLLSSYQSLNKTIVAYKNTVTGMLRDIAVKLNDRERYALYDGKSGMDVLNPFKINQFTLVAIEPLVQIIRLCTEKKKELQRTIILAGKPYREDVELLISIKGITPFTALAFISDVADISRFSSARKLTAYLGVVPLTKSSGGKTFRGHIIRTSRSTTRTLLTQSINHILSSNIKLYHWYEQKCLERGVGRARIGVVRKTVITMRSMLLKREKYRFIDEEVYQRKLDDYHRILNMEVKAPKKAA